MKILITKNIPKKGLRDLQAKYNVIYPVGEGFSKEEILEQFHDIDGILADFTLKTDRRFMEKLPNLKVIANYGVGYNNIDIEAARDLKITVCNTPNTVTPDTADLAMGLMISVMRKISTLDYRMKKDPDRLKWGVMHNLGTGLSGKTLGILGMGEIGQAVARRALPFDMTIIYHNRNPLDASIEKELEARYVDFDTLIRESDILSLHVPLFEETQGLIGKEELIRMKKTAFLINTARGPVANENALVEALKNGEIAGAGLDVFEKEPKVHPGLRELDNVVIVPHIGTATWQTRVKMAEQASRNIIHFFEGKEPPNRVK